MIKTKTTSKIEWTNKTLQILSTTNSITIITITMVIVGVVVDSLTITEVDHHQEIETFNMTTTMQPIHVGHARVVVKKKAIREYTEKITLPNNILETVTSEVTIKAININSRTTTVEITMVMEEEATMMSMVITIL